MAHTKGSRGRLVSPGWFAAMRVPIVAGRHFTTDDWQNTVRVAIVNKEFVRRFLQGIDPLRASFAAGYPNVDTRQMLQTNWYAVKTEQ